MNPIETSAWVALREAAARQLGSGFSARVLAGAEARRRELRVQNRLVLATALACFFGLNLAHWISSARVHQANLAEWQQYLAQTETLETSY